MSGLDGVRPHLIARYGISSMLGVFVGFASSEFFKGQYT